MFDAPKETIKIMAKDLANTCLLNGDKHHGYSEKDLENATLIFAHFLMDLSYTKNKHLPKAKMFVMAEDIGKAIRELIIAATDIDMHEVVKSK